jgi:DNA-binding NarL/FixJ family response regulator/GAF domain-containing protein
MVNIANRSQDSTGNSVGQIRSAPGSLIEETPHESSLLELGQLALEYTSLDDLYRAVTFDVARVTGADAVAIMLTEDDSRLQVVEATGLPAEMVGFVADDWDLEDSSTVPRVLLSPLTFSGRDTDLAVFGRRIPEFSRFATVQAAPFGRIGTPAGAICVFKKPGYDLAAENLAYLRYVALVIAGAIERSRIEENVRRESEERVILSEIGRIIGSSLEIDEVYSLFTQQVRRLIKFDRITINLIDAHTYTYSSAYVAGTPVKGWMTRAPQPIIGKGVEAVMQKRAGIIVQGENTADFVQQYPLTQIGPGCGLFSLLSVPVFWQGEVIGVLSLRSADNNAYSPRDLRVAERIAAQIAGALANAALHASQKAYAREQATLAEIGRVIAASSRITEIYPRFAEAVQKLIQFDRISINTVDEERGTAMSRYVWGTDFPGSGLMVSRQMRGTATGAVAEARRGMIITPEDVRAEPDRFSFLQAGIEAGLNSTLAVPLIYRGRVIGSLMLRSFTEHSYTLKDLTLAESIAIQISGAVWNAQLNEQLEASAKDHTLLAELARDTVHSRDLESVFAELNQALSGRFEFDRIAAATYNHEYSALHFDFVRGTRLPGMGQGDVLQRPSHIPSAVSWSELMSSHCGRGYREGFESSESIDAIVEAGLRSWLQAPLKLRERVIGVISLRSKRESAYGSRDLAFLERVAAQIAPAVDHVRFYQRAQQDHSHRTALEEMILAFGTTRSRREMLASFVGAISDAIPFDRMTISSVTSGFDLLAQEINTLANSEAWLPPSLLSLDRKISSFVTAAHRSVVIGKGADAMSEPEGPEASLLETVEAGYRSSLSVPLISAGSIAAVLHLRSESLHAYSRKQRLLVEQACMLFSNALGPLWQIALEPESRQETPSVVPAVIVVDSRRLCLHSTRNAFHHASVVVSGELENLSSAGPVMQASGTEIILWEVHADEEPDFSLIRKLHDSHPDAKVIVIDSGNDGAYVVQAIRGGAAGYILKENLLGRLNQALQNVDSGESLIDQNALRAFLENYPTYPVLVNHTTTDALEKLSERDLLILQAVANGQCNADIAANLNFAVGTIKNRLARIYKVLGVSDRAGAMALAIRSGLVL